MKIILLVLYNIYINAKFISFEYNNLLDSLNLEIKIGTMKSERYWELDLQNEITFTSPAYFEMNKTSTVSIVESGIMDYKNVKNVQYDVLKDTFNISDISLPNFHFYFFSKNLNSFDSIALAYKIRDERTSLIHHLYNNKYIDHLSFALYQRGVELGDIYFGGIDTTKVNVSNSGKCEQIKTSHKWGCKTRDVVIGDYHTKTQYDVYFQTNTIEILVPKIIVKYLNDSFFYSHVKNNSCSYYPMRKSYECSCEIVPLFPHFNFAIGDYYYRIPRYYFYEEIGGKCLFLFGENSFDEWEIGIPFFSEYAALFDYEESTITFYSRRPLEPYIAHSRFTLYILNILSLVMLMMCIVLILTMCSTKTI